MRRLFSVTPLLAAVFACNSTDQGTIQLVTGEETDVFTQAPAPTQLILQAVGASADDGGANVLASGPVSSTSIDLGSQNESDTATLQLLGETADGGVVVFGQSLPLEYGALAGGTLDLFVQRTNEYARMPNAPTDARTFPTLAIIEGEFLFIGGGQPSSIDLTTQLYDFATYSPLSAPPTMPCVPDSMPIVGTVALLLDSSLPQTAYYYDFSQDAWTPITPPGSGNTNNYTFADVAGGQSIYDVDPATGDVTGVYIVGATRTQGDPTAAVLYINPNDTSNSTYVSGNLTFYSLQVPRLGAAAVAIHNRGLVVAGGSAMGPGVEIVGPSSVAASSTFPADSTIGAGAVALPATNGATPTSIVLAGGLSPTGQDPGVRQLLLNCTYSGPTDAGASGDTCIVPWGSSTPVSLPTPITNSYTFVNGAGNSIFVVGSTLLSGATQSFLVTSQGNVTPVATKVPHTNAAAIESPVGSVLLFGGADEIESFTFPP